MIVIITKDTLYPYLIYDEPVKYNSQITLYPVSMKDYLLFQVYSKSITVRKDSWFPVKEVIKMDYLSFLVYANKHPELCVQYNKTYVKDCYHYLLFLLQMVCFEQEIKYDKYSGVITINNCEITPTIFDDIRRIIIIQDDIDFDIDEFINRDTEERLEQDRLRNLKKADISTLEDYQDSLRIILQCSLEDIKKMSIRRFWRLIKRVTMHEDYIAAHTGEFSGMVTFKEPLKHWMVEIKQDDKYGNLKADEKALKNKINGANE